MDGKELTQSQHANLVLTEYWNVLESDIGRLLGETQNGSIKKGYVNILKAVNQHKVRWNKQFESMKTDEDVTKEEQVQEP